MEVGLSPRVVADSFGGNRGLTPRQNTAVSVIAVLDAGPQSPCTLRVYHNPYAVVCLAPQLLEPLDPDQRLLPGATHVQL